MGRLDLDAARAARAAQAEVEGEEHEIVLEGQTFAAPPEMPAQFAFRLVEGNIPGALQALFGAEQYETFSAIRYSIDDLIALSDGMVKLYGFDNVGEALASRRSSQNTGKPSRPTSKRSTASISAVSSGANGQ